MNRCSRMPVAEISCLSRMRQNHHIYGCDECTLRMMGTPCFLLEQSTFLHANREVEFVPHKIQDSGAPESGVMDKENTLSVSRRQALAERTLRELQS